MDFYTDDIGSRREGAKEEWGAGIAHLGTADHYGVTDVEWDPSGRCLATSASAWRHSVSSIDPLSFPGSYRHLRNVACDAPIHAHYAVGMLLTPEQIYSSVGKRVRYLGLQGAGNSETHIGSVQAIPLAAAPTDAPYERATAGDPKKPEGVQSAV